MKQLKKCPFCGGEARLEQIPDATWDKFVVTCKSSKCCAFYIGYCDEGLYDTRGEAIAAWNTRKPMDEIVERLEEKKSEWEDNYHSSKRDGSLRRMDYADGYADGLTMAIEIVKEGLE